MYYAIFLLMNNQLRHVIDNVIHDFLVRRLWHGFCAIDAFAHPICDSRRKDFRCRELFWKMASLPDTWRTRPDDDGADISPRVTTVLDMQATRCVGFTHHIDLRQRTD